MGRRQPPTGTTAPQAADKAVKEEPASSGAAASAQPATTVPETSGDRVTAPVAGLPAAAAPTETTGAEATAAKEAEAKEVVKAGPAGSPAVDELQQAAPQVARGSGTAQDLVGAKLELARPERTGGGSIVGIITEQDPARPRFKLYLAFDSATAAAQKSKGEWGFLDEGRTTWLTHGYKRAVLALNGRKPTAPPAAAAAAATVAAAAATSAGLSGGGSGRQSAAHDKASELVGSVLELARPERTGGGSIVGTITEQDPARPRFKLYLAFDSATAAAQKSKGEWGFLDEGRTTWLTHGYKRAVLALNGGKPTADPVKAAADVVKEPTGRRSGRSEKSADLDSIKEKADVVKEKAGMSGPGPRSKRARSESEAAAGSLGIDAATAGPSGGGTQKPTPGEVKNGGAEADLVGAVLKLARPERTGGGSIVGIITEQDPARPRFKFYLAFDSATAAAQKSKGEWGFLDEGRTTWLTHGYKRAVLALEKTEAALGQAEAPASEPNQQARQEQDSREGEARGDGRGGSDGAGGSGAAADARQGGTLPAGSAQAAKRGREPEAPSKAGEGENDTLEVDEAAVEVAEDASAKEPGSKRAKSDVAGAGGLAGAGDAAEPSAGGREDKAASGRQEEGGKESDLVGAVLKLARPERTGGGSIVGTITEQDPARPRFKLYLAFDSATAAAQKSKGEWGFLDEGRTTWFTHGYKRAVLALNVARKEQAGS